MTKRILFITPGLTKGGAETQLIRVAGHLKDQGKEVIIVALKPLNNFEPQLKERGLKVVFLKSWTTHLFFNLRLLVSTFRNFRPDVVIAFMFIAIIFARLLKLRFKFYLLSSIRNSAISIKWRKIFQMTSSLDDVVIYNSKTSLVNFERQKLVSKEGIVINNAIIIPERPLSKVQRSTDTFRWVTMAHFRPSKDYVTLFNALSLIKDENFRIDVLGHIGSQQWPYDLVAKLGIQSRVNILGFKSNAVDYLKEADAFVLSSFWEGSPNAMLEAMSYCKPIVGSAVDGIEELISDAQCGFLFKQGDARDLAEKMQLIMEMTESDREKLGSIGRAYVEKYFSEEKVMQKWMGVVN